jgi:tetratricopeptide (TPR) repeat protein
MNDSDAEDLLRLAMEVQREFSGYGARAAYARLEERYGELETALSCFFEHERLDEGLQLTLATVEFWQATSRIGEGRKLLGRALSLRRTEDALRAEALFQAGMLAFWQGDDEVARQLHEQSLDQARALGDATQVALALTGIARIELRTHIDRARALSQQALDEVGSLDEVRGRSNAFHLLGVAAQMSGDLHDARHWFHERLELAKDTDNVRLVAAEAANLSVVERQLGNLERARELAREALSISERRGDEWMFPYVLNGLAGIDVAEGEHERAVILLSVADRLMGEQATAWPPDEAPHFEHAKKAASEALGPADYERLWSHGQEMSVPDAIDLALSFNAS